jgi:DNA-binding NarL/FixJ family response regulator
MALEGKVAIADKRDLAEVIKYDRGDYARFGISLAHMLVSGQTPPRKVVEFVDRERPDLMILAENFETTSETLQRLTTSFGHMADVPNEQFGQIRAGQGIAALAEVKEKHPTLPVYMFSSDPQHEQEAMHKGATGYLIAFPTPEELARLLGQSRNC